MTDGLRTAIRQTRPFASAHHEAALALIRAGAALSFGLDQVFKPHGITGTQYNVLRILRGAGESGLCRHEIIARMLTRMPDVSRLVDRLEDAGLVVRVRGASDRRQVATRLTPRGEDLLTRLDPLVQAEHQRQMKALDAEDLATLNRLLDRLLRAERPAEATDGSR